MYHTCLNCYDNHISGRICIVQLFYCNHSNNDVDKTRNMVSMLIINEFGTAMMSVPHILRIFCAYPKLWS